MKYEACGCTATISKDDERASVWFEVFGKNEFPLKYPIADIGFKADPTLRCYPGDALALTDSQKDKLVEIMAQRFGVTRNDVEEGFEKNIIPILDRNIVVSWCAIHTRIMLADAMDDEGEFF